MRTTGQFCVFSFFSDRQFNANINPCSVFEHFLGSDWFRQLCVRTFPRIWLFTPALYSNISSDMIIYASSVFEHFLGYDWFPHQLCFRPFLGSLRSCRGLATPVNESLMGPRLWYVCMGSWLLGCVRQQWVGCGGVWGCTVMWWLLWSIRVW